MNINLGIFKRNLLGTCLLLKKILVYIYISIKVSWIFLFYACLRYQNVKGANDKRYAQLCQIVARIDSRIVDVSGRNGVMVHRVAELTRAPSK